MSGRPSCVIVGRPNVGKTLLLVRFAEYLGLQEAEFEFVTPDGAVRRERLPLSRARALLVTPRRHETRGLQRIELELRRGKGARAFVLTDTTGLPDGIHASADVRLGAALALVALREAACVLHVVDAAAIGEAGPGGGIYPVDRQIAAYASLRAPYALLANKMDLPWARAGYERLRREFAGLRLIPVSALRGTGLREVRDLVRRCL